MPEVPAIPTTEGVALVAPGSTVVDEGDFDRSALEAKLTGQLGSVFDDEDDAVVDEELDGDDADLDGDEDGDGDDPEAGEEDDAPDEGNVEVDDDDVDDDPEDGDDKGAADSGTDSKAPTLPDAYRRSLKAYGWDDEKIDKNLETHGIEFLDLASNIHANRNTEVAQWAEAGRQARQQQSVQHQQTQQPQQQPQGLPETLQPVDPTLLKKELGEDNPVVESILGPVNAAIASINAILPQVQQGAQAIEQAKVETLGRQVDTFFAQDSMKPYKEFYTDVNNRNKVLEEADALSIGAHLQGRTLSDEDALNLAHNLVSADVTVKQVREGIRKKAKTRSKGRSQRPSGRAHPKKTGGEVSRSELESKVNAGLTALRS